MEWKDIPDFKGLYQASRDGYIRNTKTLHVLKTDKKINNAGYMNVTLGKFYKDVHVLIALTFIGPKPSPTHQVNHINANKLDNRASNLEWVTPKENIAHMIKAGRLDDHKIMMSEKTKGVNNIKAKLTEEQVREIRKLGATGLSSSQLAPMFNVSSATIRGIVRKAYWKHVV